MTKIVHLDFASNKSTKISLSHQVSVNIAIVYVRIPQKTSIIYTFNYLAYLKIVIKESRAVRSVRMIFLLDAF